MEMSDYTSAKGSEFNMDMFKEAIRKIEESRPLFDRPELDEFMNTHKDINKVVMITSFDELSHEPLLKTKYGDLKVKFNRILPPKTIYLMEVAGIEDFS
jgi:hypothetical protein